MSISCSPAKVMSTSLFIPLTRYFLPSCFSIWTRLYETPTFAGIGEENGTIKAIDGRKKIRGILLLSAVNLYLSLSEFSE